jgi:hypothetical protein
MERFFLTSCKANHPTQHEDTGQAKPKPIDGRSDNAAEKRREGATSAIARTTTRITYLHTSFHNCSAQPPTARQQKAQLCWYVHAKSILAPTCLFLSGRRMLRARAMALLVPEMSCSLIMQVAAAGKWASDAFSSCLIRVRWQIMERQAGARR